MNEKKFRVLLVGNPNCGKTTLFNTITRLRAKVGNYSGVTVDRKIGNFRLNDTEVEVEDLPGLYTFSVSSAEEKISKQSITDGEFDLILNVVDSSNYERNLYLTLQLAEMAVPMAVVLNMTDELEKNSKFIDAKKLSETLGVPVIKAVAYNVESVNRLKEFLLEAIKKPAAANFPWRDIDENYFSNKFTLIRAAINEELPENFAPWAKWLALRALENDADVLGKIEEKSPSLRSYIQSLLDEIEAQTGEYAEVFVAAARYKLVSKIVDDTLMSMDTPPKNMTKFLDGIFLNKFLGIPIFFVMMYCVFQFVFTLGDPIMGLMEDFFSYLASFVSGFWAEGEQSALHDFIVDGIIGGVGGVFVFLPNIILLFFALAILEDSGYMARAAFLCDRAMKRFGISGSSIIPMLIGFGCSVPAIIGTRTLKSKVERLVTIMILPLFSCGARFPVYVLLIPAFFPAKYSALAMFGIYIVGIILALIYAKVLRLSVFKGAYSSFIIELPPYRMPILKNMLLQIWTRAFGFIKKAGTLILAMAVILWFASTYPKKEELSKDYDAQIAKIEADATLDAEKKSGLISEIEDEKMTEEFDYTVSGRVGSALEPIFSPIGFDKRITSALIGALAAKEVFITQLGIVYGMGDEEDEESESLRQKIGKDYTMAQGISILLFVLLSLPCIATLATTFAETRSVAMALAQALGLTVMAYVVCLVFYQTWMFFS